MAWRESVAASLRKARSSKKTVLERVRKKAQARSTTLTFWVLRRRLLPHLRRRPNLRRRPHLRVPPHLHRRPRLQESQLEMEVPGSMSRRWLRLCPPNLRFRKRRVTNRITFSPWFFAHLFSRSAQIYENAWLHLESNHNEGVPRVSSTSCSPHLCQLFGPIPMDISSIAMQKHWSPPIFVNSNSIQVFHDTVCAKSRLPKLTRRPWGL
jgi:hypothetical protein